jgi:hypothetical protein
MEREIAPFSTVEVIDILRHLSKRLAEGEELEALKEGIEIIEWWEEDNL